MRNAIRDTSIAVFIALAVCAGPSSAADDFLEQMRKAADQVGKEHMEKLKQGVQQPAQQPQQRRQRPQSPQPTSPESQTLPSQPSSQNAPVPAGSAGDCCTPETTARIAANAGFVDVVGIKLGMPVKEAVAAIKKHNPKLQTGTSAGSSYRFDLLPNVNFVDSVKAMGQGPSEVIDLYLTMPPNQDVVWFVSRSIDYDGDTRPTVANVIAALREKYGPEDGSMRDKSLTGTGDLMDAYWVFDANGKKVSTQQAKGYVAVCAGHDGPDLNHLRQPPVPNRWMRNNINCGEITMVFANWTPTSAMTGPPGLVLQVMIRAYNNQLHRSAFEASQAMILQAEENQANKEQQKAKQVKPAF